MDTLKPLVDRIPAVMFSKSSTDPVSYSVKQLFTPYGANLTVYELDEMPNSQEIESALHMLGQSPSVPAVFIGGSLVGGANDIISLQLRGELGQMLMDAGAIWVWKRNQQ